MSRPWQLDPTLPGNAPLMTRIVDGNLQGTSRNTATTEFRNMIASIDRLRIITTIFRPSFRQDQRSDGVSRSKSDDDVNSEGGEQEV